MKARFWKCLVGSVLFLAFGSSWLAADETPIATGTIDLRQPANLKMIFDGGLRPFRTEGLESEKCSIERYNITIILPNSKPFTFPVQDGDFDVLAGNEIYSINLLGLYTTVPEGVALTKTICKAWDVSTNGFDEGLTHLGHMPGDWEGWGQEFNLNQPRIRAQVVFKTMYYFDHVGAQVDVFIFCGDYPHGMKFLTGPIQPPAGYENVSMNPPPFKPSNPPVPLVSFEQARAGIQAALVKIQNRKRYFHLLRVCGAATLGLVILAGIGWCFMRSKKQK